LTVNDAREKIQKAFCKEDEPRGMVVFQAGGGDPVKTKGIVRRRQERFLTKTGFSC
jgi:hypothetical protein